MATALAIAIGVFHENKGRSWFLAAKIAAMRYLFSRNWDIHTLRSFLGVTTSQGYHSWARQEKQEVLTDMLPEGAKLHWIGPRRDENQDRVFLFFHGELIPRPVNIPHRFADQFPQNGFSTGGGFSLPARPDYFQFLCALQKGVSASLGNVGVAMLEYCEPHPIPAPIALQLSDNFAFTFSADPRFSFPDSIETGQCGADTSFEQGNFPDEYSCRR